MGKRSASVPEHKSKKLRSQQPVKAKKAAIPEPEPEPEAVSEESPSESSEEEVSSDEDELDELDELDEVNSDNSNSDVDEIDEDMEVEEEGTGGGSTLSAAEKSAKRQEQKAMRNERKLGKAHGHEIEDIKKLWEKMRTKALATEVRRKFVDEAYDAVDKLGWKEVVFRHDSSRVVQTIFKHSTKEQRAGITNALKGSYVDLAKSSYGKYLLVKMLHYGSAALRSQILDELHGNFRKLMGHREGAYVIEDAYRDYATAPQRRQMLREFYGSEFALFKEKGENASGLKEILEQFPEKRPYLLDNLNKVITAAVNKGSIGFEIVQAAMLEYVRNIDPNSSDRETFIDLIADQIADMVHTSAGSQVASLVVALANAKERKRIIRAVRPFADKLAKDQFGQLVLTSIFMCVDDTVLVHKAFAPTYEPIMGELMCDRYGRRAFLYLLVGESPKYFAAVKPRFDEINQFKKLTSKKEDAVRRQELRAAFSGAMLEAAFHVPITSTLGMQFEGDLLTSLTKNKDEAASSDAFIHAVRNLENAFSGSATEDVHPIQSNPFGCRVAKQLVRNVPLFAFDMSELISHFPVEWSISEGNFVVISLLEVLPDPEPFRKLLKSHYKQIAEGSREQGRDLLLKLISGKESPEQSKELKGHKQPKEHKAQKEHKEAKNGKKEHKKKNGKK